MSVRVLIVDDSEGYTRLAHKFLRRYEYATNCEYTHPCWECPHRRGCDLKHAHNWAEVEQIMERYDGRIDVVLLDVNFDLPEDQLIAEPGLPGSGSGEVEALRRHQGFHILRRLRAQQGRLPVVLMTSQRHVAFNEAELKADLAEEEYTQLLDDEDVSAQALASKIERARRIVAEDPRDDGDVFWGRSRAMARLRRWIEVVATGDQPLVILGETGTGKSFLAEHVIHPLARPGKTFCAIDLSTIPENLVAAELFGSSKGAYSGAVAREGRFEYANGGTLFLDEIGNLSLELQKQLLAVLQDRRVTRLGENRPRAVDVKLVVATNEDLEQRVREGTFRADLYQRLNPAARLVLPPLRERKEDLRGLAEFLLKRIFASRGNRKLLADFGRMFQIDPGAVKPALLFADTARGRQAEHTVAFQLAGLAWETLAAYDYPGNTRELEMILANALLFSLADALAAGRVSDRPVVNIDAQVVRSLVAASHVKPREVEPDGADHAQRCIVRLQPHDSLNNTSREVERQYFEELFVRCAGSFERMAAVLLEGDVHVNARKVQLRFNNLGLSVRDLRDRFGE